MDDSTPDRRVTVFFDIDNTLIDNDRAKTELSARIAALLGEKGERRFWGLYEDVRREQGLVNIPLMLARFGDRGGRGPRLERRRAATATLRPRRHRDGFSL